MAADYGTRSKAASLFTEVVGIMSVVEHTRSHVKQWMRPTKLMRTARLCGLRAEVQPTPLGVVGIIGPWNFPIGLVVQPAASAFAAGNRVMIKFSEVTARTAELFAAKAATYFDPTELTVVTGGAEVGAAFSALPFDHLFFTGSPQVGALVAAAAAKNLVPVTLELGGKNPAVIARDADVPAMAERMHGSRLGNGGQICFCPDYVRAPRPSGNIRRRRPRDAARHVPPSSADGELVSVDDKNFQRVTALIDDARASGARSRPLYPAIRYPTRSRNAPTVVGITDDHADRAGGNLRPGAVGPALSKIDEASTMSRRDRRRWPRIGTAQLISAFVASTLSGGVARNDFAALRDSWRRRSGGWVTAAGRLPRQDRLRHL